MKYAQATWQKHTLLKKNYMNIIKRRKYFSFGLNMYSAVSWIIVVMTSYE